MAGLSHVLTPGAGDVVCSSKPHGLGMLEGVVPQKNRGILLPEEAGSVLGRSK